MNVSNNNSSYNNNVSPDPPLPSYHNNGGTHFCGYGWNAQVVVDVPINALMGKPEPMVIGPLLHEVCYNPILPHLLVQP